MNRLLYTIILIPYIVHAQGKAVQFEQGLSWDEVRAKAKLEDKYIFLDCFATWCGPCKEMDKNVYSDEKLGDFMNTRFISVKVQMDTSKQDNEDVQEWYKESHNMMRQYKITAFPFFLFFSPNGKIVHQQLGFKDASGFLTLARDAMDTNKQYYPLLEDYQKGKRNYSVMTYLAETANTLGDKELGNTIARDYMNNYLAGLKEEELYTKANIDFILSFIQILGSNDAEFNLFYRHGTKVDQILQRKISRAVVDYVIAKEEIDPKLWVDNKPIIKNPDWGKTISIISKKYSASYAERTVLDAQIRWYESKKDWPELTKYNIKKIEKYGLDTVGFGKASLDNMIWGVIFMHSNDRDALKKSIRWMEIILNTTSPNSPADIDTYANLLYKVGRRQEALAWEQKAMELGPEEKEIHDNYVKMKRGEPTWLEE